MNPKDHPLDSPWQRIVLLRPPTYAILLLSPIAFVIVMLSLWRCNWADVTITYQTFNGTSHTLEADIGLKEVLILLASQGAQLTRQVMSYHEAAQVYGHLPVFRHHNELHSAGLLARVLLWASQACCGGMLLSVLTRLLCKRPGVSVTISLAVLQGLVALAGVLGWYWMLPSIGTGRTFRFYVGVGFRSVLGASICQLVLAAGIGGWAYQLHTKDFKFQRLPTSEDCELDMDPEGTSAVEIEMDSPWGKKKVRGDTRFDVDSRVGHSSVSNQDLKGSNIRGASARDTMFQALGKGQAPDYE